MAASFALPMLAAAPAGASVASGKTVNEDITVTITSSPTTTTTTTVPPTTTTQTTHPTAVVTAARTAAATATPPPIAFTGAPIMAELELAAFLLIAGGAIFGVLRFFGRRRT